MGTKLCVNCQTRETPRDPSSGADAHHPYCFRCFGLIYDAPRCHHDPCRQARVYTQLVNFAAAGAGEPAHYRCVNGHDHGDRSGWQRAASVAELAFR